MERGDGDGSMDDRISKLPQPILHHILSLLSQSDAVRTCILSKSWRYLGPTRPKIEFHEGNKKKLMSVLDNTLQRCDDQKLPIQEFVLRMWWPDSSNNSCPLLNKWIVKLQMLKRLFLHHVCIEDELFEKILSSCPLIEHLVLDSCRGLSTVKVNKARNLKHFECDMYGDNHSNDDVPSLETIRITSRTNWYRLHNNYFFPRLKSLYLRCVHLPTESLNNLSSNNCPCLEELELHYCPGFSEFKLSNRSIKRLIIILYDRPIMADIDAANMLYFEFRSSFLPSISFATTLREWKSRIHVGCYSDPSWYLNLCEFLMALSQSQVSLDITYLPLTNQDTYDGGSCEPVVVVEHLYLREYCPSSSLPDLLNCLFRICRPRYIRLPFYSYSQKIYERQLAESIWKSLVKKGETRQCDFWQQDLEESSIQVLQENTHEWRPGQVCEFSNNEKFRFRLKWRDLS